MGFYTRVDEKEKKEEFSARKKVIARSRNIVENNSKGSSLALSEFMKDWEGLRTRHKGQLEIIDAFFNQKKKYIFLRIGRKGAKTTTIIDVAWRFAHENPRCMIYICLPTVVQACDVYWDEKRLQWCDHTDCFMADKYIQNIDNRNHSITFNNGSVIKLIGTWAERSGRGTQPDLFISDEIQDCKGDYLDAMEPNLAAKEDARCIMAGTPPRRPNHYHDWEKRIINNPEGFRLHYSSYINTALPHLHDWLDKKRKELFDAGKEDVWFREFMAEDCFRSDDRVLPDVNIFSEDEIRRSILQQKDFITPVVSIVYTKGILTVNYSAVMYSRYTGTKVYNLESTTIKRMWDKSYMSLNQEIDQKIETFDSLFCKRWIKIAYDETKSLSDVLPSFANARSDLKWQDRGIPLLKELILTQSILFADKASQIGLESQNYLKEDDVKDYPNVCAMAMLANEFYQGISLSKPEKEKWDKFAPLRDAGICVTRSKKKGTTSLFSKNWD